MFEPSPKTTVVVPFRTGPDGALWVVDMYRFLIEHPRWIPPERLKSLDPRAGRAEGRQAGRVEDAQVPHGHPPIAHTPIGRPPIPEALLE